MPRLDDYIATVEEHVRGIEPARLVPDHLQQHRLTDPRRDRQSPAVQRQLSRCSEDCTDRSTRSWTSGSAPVRRANCGRADRWPSQSLPSECEIGAGGVGGIAHDGGCPGGDLPRRRGAVLISLAVLLHGDGQAEPIADGMDVGSDFFVALIGVAKGKGVGELTQGE